MNICSTVTDDVPMVAVVGMAGRFPQASGIAEFWDNLCAGRECFKRFTAAELRAAGVPQALCADERYVPVNGVLADVELFDAAFFGMTPRDASITDPQQRIFLELAWDALEHAGYDPGRYPGRIGVYAGCGPSSYFLHNLLPNRAALADIAELRLQMGNNPSYLATRLSYQLNLTGPSLTIGTACSTSLVAIHMACDALRDHQCDIALAGGISVQFPQVRGYLYETDSILSPDGHCRAFDARAQGTVSGNGGAVVVLKRLADALKENDAIYAVIRGSAVNNDGAEKSGYTAPSVRGQMRAIYEAQAVAGVPADTIGYVETHGTATQLGDPIEFEALTRAFRQQTTRNQFCAIGSVKTNVGHLDEGAGVTGFIKTVLCLQHRQIPPSLHFQVPNPELAYATSPFRVADALMDFPAPGPGVPRRAAVSSFGIGGTNAHVVLEEPPPVEAAAPSRAVQLLLLSARTAGELEEMTSRLARHLQAKPDICVADVAYTLQVGRKEFPYRRMALCRSREEAVSALEARTPQRVVTALASSSARPIVFLFPGQGSQHVDMGAGLYESERCFRDAVDRCADFLRPQLGLDLRSAMFSRDGQAAEAQLERTELAQPALFIIAYALAQQLSSFGIRPRAMIGHSIGEYVAACLAGVFALEDALTLVAERGRLMQSMPPGGMLAVELAERELLPLLGENLTLAAVNAPSLCVVAGPITAIRTMQEQLSGRGIACRRLHTSHAFHSRFMDPILEPFLQRVHAATRNPPAIPFVSNVTGSWIAAEQATDPQYWASHLRHTVRFSEGVRQLMREGDNVFLEVGPGQGLAGLVRRHFDRGAEPAHRRVRCAMQGTRGTPLPSFSKRLVASGWQGRAASRSFAMPRRSAGAFLCPPIHSSDGASGSTLPSLARRTTIRRRLRRRRQRDRPRPVRRSGWRRRSTRSHRFERLSTGRAGSSSRTAAGWETVWPSGCEWAAVVFSPSRQGAPSRVAATTTSSSTRPSLSNTTA